MKHATASGLYLNVLAELLGADSKAAPRGMETKEVRAAQVVLNDPACCVVDVAERKLNYHFMVAEWWWIASGDDRVASIGHYCSEISRFSDDGATFFGAYGPRWRPQAEAAVRRLDNDRDSRQAVVSTWRTDDDWRNWKAMLKTKEAVELGDVVSKDVPCTLTMQYLVRGGKLETIVTMRSWDAWLGMPYDLFNFARLGAAVAGELGVEQGPLVVQAGSLHLYERNFEAARSLVDYGMYASTREPPLPGLPPANQMRAWEAQARVGYLGTAADPWCDYLTVMSHRSNKQMRLSQRWRHRVNGGQETLPGIEDA